MLSDSDYVSESEDDVEPPKPLPARGKGKKKARVASKVKPIEPIKGPLLDKFNANFARRFFKTIRLNAVLLEQAGAFIDTCTSRYDGVDFTRLLIKLIKVAINSSNTQLLRDCFEYHVLQKIKVKDFLVVHSSELGTAHGQYPDKWNPDLLKMLNNLELAVVDYPEGLACAFLLFNRKSMWHEGFDWVQTLGKWGDGILAASFQYYHCLLSPGYGPNHPVTKKLSDNIFAKLKAEPRIAKAFAHLNMLREYTYLDGRRHSPNNLDPIKACFLPSMVFYDPNFFLRLIKDTEIHRHMTQGFVEVERYLEPMGEVCPFAKLLCHTLLLMKNPAQYRSVFVKRIKGRDSAHKIHIDKSRLFAQIKYLQHNTQFPGFMLSRVSQFYQTAQFSRQNIVYSPHDINDLFSCFEGVLAGSASLALFRRNLTIERFLFAIKPTIGIPEMKVFKSLPEVRRPLWLRALSQGEVILETHGFIEGLYDAAERLANLFSLSTTELITHQKPRLRLLASILETNRFKKRSFPVKFISAHIMEFLCLKNEYDCLMKYLHFSSGDCSGLLQAIVFHQTGEHLLSDRAMKSDTSSVLVRETKGIAVQAWQKYEPELSKKAHVWKLAKGHAAVLNAFVPTNPKYVKVFFHLCLLHAAVKNKAKIQASVLKAVLDVASEAPPHICNTIMRQLASKKTVDPQLLIQFVTVPAGEIKYKFHQFFDFFLRLVRAELEEQKEVFSKAIGQASFLSSLGFEPIFCLYAALLFCDQKKLIKDSGIKDYLLKELHKKPLLISIMRDFIDFTAIKDADDIVSIGKCLFLTRLVLEDPAFLPSLLFYKGVPIVIHNDMVYLNILSGELDKKTLSTYAFLLSGVLRKVYGEAFVPSGKYLLHSQMRFLGLKAAYVHSRLSLQKYLDGRQSSGRLQTLLPYYQSGLNLYLGTFKEQYFKNEAAALDLPDRLSPSQGAIVAFFFEQAQLFSKSGLKMFGLGPYEHFASKRHLVVPEGLQTPAKAVDPSLYWRALLYAYVRTHRFSEDNDRSKYYSAQYHLFHPYIFDRSDALAAFMNKNIRRGLSRLEVNLVVMIYKILHGSASLIMKLLNDYDEEAVIAGTLEGLSEESTMNDQDRKGKLLLLFVYEDICEPGRAHDYEDLNMAIDIFVRLYDQVGIDEKQRAILLPAIKYIYQEAKKKIIGGYRRQINHFDELMDIIKNPTNRGGGAGPGAGVVATAAPVKAAAPKIDLTRSRAPKRIEKLAVADDSDSSSESDISDATAKRRRKGKAKAKRRRMPDRADAMNDISVPAGASFAFAGPGIDPKLLAVLDGIDDVSDGVDLD